MAMRPTLRASTSTASLAPSSSGSPSSPNPRASTSIWTWRRASGPTRSLPWIAPVTRAIQAIAYGCALTAHRQTRT
ncbi:MAG: hypothetical protein ACK55I_25735, partial [bacterium]